MAKALLIDQITAVLSDSSECDQRRCPVAKCICYEQARALVETFAVRRRQLVWSDAMIAQLRELHGKGLSVRRITREMGLAPGSTLMRIGAVRGMIRRLELEPGPDQDPATSNPETPAE